MRIGITTSIPFAAISCGCSNTSIKALLDKVYDIDDNNVLKGFKSDFLNNPDSDIYKDKFTDCNLMIIPVNVTSIAFDAFFVSRPVQYTTILEYIKKVTFAKGSNLTSLSAECFEKFIFTSIDFSNCNNLTSLVNQYFGASSLTSIKFPKNLRENGNFIFARYFKLVSINLLNLC
ncbi:MAG: leucine-rich repeat domain-containing protein [Mycoplasmoidaceae bacterium]|nr:leucine-rich repeat domain-containing protein [Mycoplasmoidaceae bacterium]